MTATAARRLALWGTLLLVLAVVAAVLGGLRGTNQLPLDPANADDDGIQALARVLEQEGISVSIVRGLPALLDRDLGPGTNLLVAGTGYLSEDSGRALMRHAQAADTVTVLAPAENAGDVLGLPVQVSSRSLGTPARPRCEQTWVSWRDGDELHRAEQLIDVVRERDAARVCFPPSPGYNAGGSMAGYVVELLPQERGDRPRVVLAGIAGALTNEHIEDGAHAAAGLRLLGSAPHLVWYVPQPGDAGDEAPAQGLVDVLPRGVVPSVVLLLGALAAAMVWRGRRLGPVVTEPLPAVVRSVETTQSRSRMYQRAGDRERALASLQLAARRRLSGRLGLAASTRPDEVVQATARATGRHTGELHRLLVDATAPDDETLVRIAREVRSLEEGMIG